MLNPSFCWSNPTFTGSTYIFPDKTSSFSGFNLHFSVLHSSALKTRSAALGRKARRLLLRRTRCLEVNWTGAGQSTIIMIRECKTTTRKWIIYIVSYIYCIYIYVYMINGKYYKYVYIYICVCVWQYNYMYVYIYIYSNIDNKLYMTNDIFIVDVVSML